MRAAALVGLCLALLGASACKKKSKCVQECERYAKCDPESVTDCSKACEDMPAKARDQLYHCDEAAKGECDEFLICTGVKSRPSHQSGGIDAAIMSACPRPTPAVMGVRTPRLRGRMGFLRRGPRDDRRDAR